MPGILYIHIDSVEMFVISDYYIFESLKIGGKRFGSKEEVNTEATGAVNEIYFKRRFLLRKIIYI